MLVQGTDDTFTIAAHKLQTVQMVNCYAPIDSPALEIYSLQFTSHFHVRPALQVVYRDLLRASAGNLTRLELINGVRFNPLSIPFSHTTDPINFPALERLRIRGNASHVCAVLRLLVWPRTGTTVSVKATVRNGPAQSLEDKAEILNLMCTYTPVRIQRLPADNRLESQFPADTSGTLYTSNIEDPARSQQLPPYADGITASRSLGSCPTRKSSLRDVRIHLHGGKLRRRR